jgi:undecaprenyl-diphosphatase
MNLEQTFLYGLVQGLTEFLPVSSSGHLALLPFFLTLKDPGVFFDLAMHMGTALAVILYFRSEVFNLVQEYWKFVFKRQRPSFFALNILVCTLATIVGIFLIKPFAESLGRYPLTIAFNLFFFGALLAYSQRFSNLLEENLRKHLSWKFVLLIGMAQALAIFPGVSRSGITLTMAFFLGLKRKAAAEFSFLLSLPIIIMGFAYKSLGVLKQDESVAFLWSDIWLGIFFSFITGILCVGFLMKFIERIPFSVFFYYRAILAALIVFFTFQGANL